MEEYSTILQNAKYCDNCDEYLVSWHVHDFTSCTCGHVSADGGFDYLHQTIEGEDFNLSYGSSISDIKEKYLVYDLKLKRYVTFAESSEASLLRYDALIQYPSFIPIWEKMRDKVDTCCDPEDLFDTDE